METIQITIPDGCKVQVVRKRKEKEPVIRTYQDLYDRNSDAPPLDNNWAVQSLCESTKVTEKVAKSMLAMAMISQLMPYYGGAITDEEWNNSNMFKYVIKNERGKIWTTYVYTIHDYLAFHTAKQRDNFLKYNERLVKDFLMID